MGWLKKIFLSNLILQIENDKHNNPSRRSRLSHHASPRHKIPQFRLCWCLDRNLHQRWQQNCCQSSGLYPSVPLEDYLRGLRDSIRHDPKLCAGRRIANRWTVWGCSPDQPLWWPRIVAAGPIRLRADSLQLQGCHFRASQSWHEPQLRWHSLGRTTRANQRLNIQMVHRQHQWIYLACR